MISHYQNLPTSPKANKPIELARSLMRGGDVQGVDTCLEMALGQARRARQRLLHGTVEDHIGYNSLAVEERLSVLAEVKDDLIIVPSWGDRSLSGRPAYPGGNPPSPYQWAPIISRHTKPGDVIWEFGPGVVASSMYSAEVLQRESILVALPVAGSKCWLRSVPTVHAPGGNLLTNPAAHAPKRESEVATLALVPLPLPSDAWSLFQHKRLRAEEDSELDPTWVEPSAGTGVGDVHPEFSQDIGQYLCAVGQRLVAIFLHMPTGSRICVSSPMVQGVPKAVEELIRTVLDWLLRDRMTVLYEGGATHRGDGSPLVGEEITVWEIQR